MLPSPAELQYFVEVAATLNISRAAERLGISQPSLSLAVRRLEDNLGVQLLIRGKTGVRLTRAGERLAGHARDLLQGWDMIKAETIRGESEVAGRYILGCHTSIAMFSLPLFLPGMLLRYPQLEIRLRHGLSRQITDEVINFNVDFGLVINPVEHPELVIKTLSRDEVTFWVSAVERKATMDTVKDLILVHDPDLIQSQTLIRKAERLGTSFPRTVGTSSLEVVTALVAGGGCTGIIPTRVAIGGAAGRVIPVQGAPVFTDRLCLIYRADRQSSRGARALLRMIEDAFQEP